MYEEAFREAGFDKIDHHPEVAAERVKASNIQNALLDAIDNWSFCARDPRRQRWAMEVAQRADGDTTGWRGRARDPAIWKDEATLFKVIETAPFPEQSVALLLAIGDAYECARGRFASRFSSASMSDTPATSGSISGWAAC